MKNAISGGKNILLNQLKRQKMSSISFTSKGFLEKVVDKNHELRRAEFQAQDFLLRTLTCRDVRAGLSS